MPRSSVLAFILSRMSWLKMLPSLTTVGILLASCFKMCGGMGAKSTRAGWARHQPGFAAPSPLVGNRNCRLTLSRKGRGGAPTILSDGLVRAESFLPGGVARKMFAKERMCNAHQMRLPTSLIAMNIASGGGGGDEDINVGDIVEFNIPGLISVGFVEKKTQGMLEVMRLVRREGVGEECYLDESQPVLYIEADRCRFVDSYPSQRVAWSTSSPHHNPHGEESEDVWFLESELSPECEIPVKPISET